MSGENKNRPISELSRQWPADWPDRVSIQPVEDYLARKGRPPMTEAERDLLLSLRGEAQRTKLPPYISISLRDRLKKIGDPAHIQTLMGIPVLRKRELAECSRFWRAERKRLGLPPVGQQLPGWQNPAVQAQIRAEREARDAAETEAACDQSA